MRGLLFALLLASVVAQACDRCPITGRPTSVSPPTARAMLDQIRLERAFLQEAARRVESADAPRWATPDPGPPAALAFARALYEAADGRPVLARPDRARFLTPTLAARLALAEATAPHQPAAPPAPPSRPWIIERVTVRTLHVIDADRVTIEAGFFDGIGERRQRLELVHTHTEGWRLADLELPDGRQLSATLPPLPPEPAPQPAPALAGR